MSALAFTKALLSLKFHCAKLKRAELNLSQQEEFLYLFQIHNSRLVMNKLFAKKIENLHHNLMENYRDTKEYSPSITGSEREIFTRELLTKVLPEGYRMGAGTIVDQKGKETGQVDVVIELPLSLSFPISSVQNRLYLANTVGAAIEVKSDLKSKWKEASDKIVEIKSLWRRETMKGEIVHLDNISIPSFVVAFTGYKNLDAVISKILERPNVREQPDGVLIIDKGVFYGRAYGQIYEVTNHKAGSILAFIDCLYSALLFSHQNIANLYAYKDLLLHNSPKIPIEKKRKPNPEVEHISFP